MIDFMKSLFFLTFMSFTENTESSRLKITRDVKDITYGSEQCSWFDRADGYSFKCYCKKDYTTMLSDTNTAYDCVQPMEIGCKYNLMQTLQAYLVTTNNAVRKLLGETTDATQQLVKDISSNDLSMKNITVWQYQNGKGHYSDITKEASPYFSLDKDKQSLRISDLKLATWGGHAVRIYFSDDNCLALKIKGTQTYPYDINQFKAQLSQKVVTKAPRPTSPRFKPTKGPIVSRILGGSSQSSTIIMAVIIAVLFLAVIVLVYQRRKMTKSYSSQKDFQGTSSSSSANKFPSVINNAYAPDQYRNDVFIAPPETPPNCAVIGTINGNPDGRVGHVAENPIYNCYVDKSSTSGDDVSKSSKSSDDK